MTRRLVLSFMTITIFGLAVVVIPLGRTFASRENDRLLFDIERDATVVASYAEDALEAGFIPDLAPLLDDYATDLGRVVVVNNEGLSVYDSVQSDVPPRDFSTRPEIVDALEGRRSDGTRYSQTLGYELMYVAVPVASGGTVHGAVRITYPTSTLDARIADTWLQLGALSGIVLIIVAGAGWLLARSVTRPVQEVRDAAIGLAEGDLTRRAPIDMGAPELRQLAATFNESASTLEELVESQRRFVADASHQLRTPLTALRLRLENLEPDIPVGSRPELVAAITETERLARLVDGLLTLAGNDQPEPVVESINLASALAERQALWGPQATNAGVTLEVDDQIAGSVQAVEGAVEQIIDNLIANALSISPGGSTITITIQPDDDPNHVVLHVLDEGPGMRSEHMEHAFDRFWRAPGSPSRGSGLGLAIVADLAQASGGDATLSARPGGGLDAAVRLKTSPTAAPATGPDDRLDFLTLH